MAEISLAFPITPEHFSFEPLPEQLLEARLDADASDPETIARLVAVLDAIDGDCDLELTGDERDGDCDLDEAAVPI